MGVSSPPPIPRVLYPGSDFQGSVIVPFFVTSSTCIKCLSFFCHTITRGNIHMLGLLSLTDLEKVGENLDATTNVSDSRRHFTKVLSLLKQSLFKNRIQTIIIARSSRMGCFVPMSNSQVQHSQERRV